MFNDTMLNFIIDHLVQTKEFTKNITYILSMYREDKNLSRKTITIFKTLIKTSAVVLL